MNRHEGRALRGVAIRQALSERASEGVLPRGTQAEIAAAPPAADPPAAEPPAPADALLPSAVPPNSFAAIHAFAQRKEGWLNQPVAEDRPLSRADAMAAMKSCGGMLLNSFNSCQAATGHKDATKFARNVKEAVAAAEAFLAAMRQGQH